MLEYSVLPLSLSGKESFIDASKEELRVLLALIECGGEIESEESLAALASTTKARCAAALTLWREEGVIRLADKSPTVTEEFEERLRKGEIIEVGAKEVAASIRDSALADMISECTKILEKSSLNTDEIKRLTALHEQYGLSPEYIITLAAYMKNRSSRLSVVALVNKAIKLHEKEIDDLSSLEGYISDTENTSEAEKAFRKIFGIYDRSLTKSEKDAFARWSRTYGYYTEIVTEAYDIAVNHTSRGYVSYADKLLTAWYEAGCRTVSDCKRKYEADAEERKTRRNQNAKAAHQSKKSAEDKERYGSFDAGEALMKALERSFGEN